MNTIPIDRITISESRQRTVFDEDALVELRESIEDRGLLHPIVLRREALPGAPEQFTLVAGERRLRAIKEIFALGGTFRHGTTVYGDSSSRLIPYTDMGELSQLEAEEVELDENIKRRDLSWPELALVHERLHKLRVAQKEAVITKALDLGVDISSNPAPVPLPHTIADTAEELTGRRDGSYYDSVRKELIVAQHLGKPEIAKAKSLDEAFKILKAQEQRTKNQELAVSIGATFNASSHQLLNINCLEFMRTAADGPEEKKFDVILTDPPYGMNAQAFGDAAGKLLTIGHQYDDSYESWVTLMTDWCGLSFQVAKAQAHAYVFCDIDRFHELKLFMQKAGWYVFRTPLTVYKLNSGRVPLPDRGPRRQSEWILYAIKGDKPVNQILPDVIPCQGDDNLGHGAQKPVALFENLLSRSVQPGNRVYDGFCGSGTIFPAAHTHKCLAVGNELDAGSYGIAARRLAELKNLETPSALPL